MKYFLKIDYFWCKNFSDGDDDGDGIPLKATNPIAAAGAVKEALATGGVDKVMMSVSMWWDGNIITLQSGKVVRWEGGKMVRWQCE